MMQPTTTNDPAVDPARIDGLYSALGEMQVELDADPLELGPKRMNEKIAQCRGMLSRCETIFLSVSQDLYRYKRSLRAATADFQLRRHDLMANDPEVRMGRNVADREAVVGTKLRTEQEEITRLTACTEDLETVIIVVKTKRADLKDIHGRLKDQLKVCQEELGLGGRWGKKLPPSVTKRAPDPAGDEVNDLMDSLLVKKDAEAKNGIPLELIGDVEVLADDLLVAIPDDGPEEDPSVPFVRHPDSAFVADDGVDELLGLLGK